MVSDLLISFYVWGLKDFRATQAHAIREMYSKKAPPLNPSDTQVKLWYIQMSLSLLMQEVNCSGLAILGKSEETEQTEIATDKIPPCPIQSTPVHFDTSQTPPSQEKHSAQSLWGWTSPFAQVRISHLAAESADASILHN